MRAWLIRLALIVALSGGVLWFWRLGDMPKVDGGGLSLRRSTGAVEVLKEGDTARTEDETATISFFGLAETRLAPHSIIAITKASRPYAFGSGIAVDMDLKQGSAWSRVQKLFDPEAAFRVRVGQMTASVRGTSFDVHASATGSSVTVADAAVEIEVPSTMGTSGIPDAPIIVGEGSVMTFDGAGKILSTKSIAEDMRQSDRYVANMRQDQRFDADTSERVRSFTDALGTRPLEGVLAGIVALSERAHMRLAPTDAPHIAALQALRRVALMKHLADAGMTGLAFEAWDVLKRDMASYAMRPDGKAYTSAIRHALQDGMLLLSDTLPGSPVYPLKLDVEGAFIDMSKDDPVEYQHARLVGIDARLDEAGQLISGSSLDVAESGLDAARDGIANVERELDRLPAGIAADRTHLVRSKLFVIKSREAALRIRLATAKTPPISTVR